MSASTPGVSAQDAPDAHEAAFQGSVFLHGLDEVGGAAGRKTTPRAGAGYHMQRAAQETLVEANRSYDYAFEHGGSSFFFRWRAINLSISFSSAA